MVQHSSDGNKYKDLGSVSSNGERNVISEYAFTHTTPSIGENYYRVIQYDADGSTSSSGVRPVNIEGQQINVFPNPSTESFTLSLSGIDLAEVSVIDLFGHPLYQGTLTEGQHLIGAALPPGLYIVQVATGGTVKVIKVAKQ